MSKNAKPLKTNLTETADTPAIEPAAPPPAATAAPAGATPPSETAGSPDEAPAADELQALKDRAAKADEYWDRLLRVSADFENFKKRAARERQEAMRFANESLLTKLIPVLDHFEAALAAANSETAPASPDAFKQGVSLIYNQLRSLLGEAGLEEISADGQAFDPTLHEAVAQEETPDHPEGQVVRQLRKGYKLRERLLRPASVVVARAPANPSAAS
jgi:molecular chaperone GrpE